MAYRTRTLAERPQLLAHFERLHAVAWPPFLRDNEVNGLWPRLYRDFADYQIGLEDGSGRIVAVGNTIPFVWNGTPGDLPGGIAGIIRNGIAARRSGRQPTALSALAAIVDPRRRALGLSARVVSAMSRLAAAHNLRALVAPVRPSHKGRYPLTSMERYAAWRRPDGAPFDPWIRVHWRLGARVLRVIPRANTVRATVAEWEERTGLRFPESGRYVVPDAFRPIAVDRKRNRVQYSEENVWMLHPVPRRRAGQSGTRRRTRR